MQNIVLEKKKIFVNKNPEHIQESYISNSYIQSNTQYYLAILPVVHLHIPILYSQQ